MEAPVILWAVPVPPPPTFPTRSSCENDLDECESGEVRCAQLRINYLGNYKCRCQEGFISSDGDGCDGKFLKSNMKSLCDGAIHAGRTSEAKG